MIGKTLLAVGGVLALLATPAFAQADRGAEHTPETLGAGRSQSGPAGDLLTEPAQPTEPARGPAQQAITGESGAANAVTGVDESTGRALPDQGRQTPPTEAQNDSAAPSIYVRTEPAAKGPGNTNASGGEALKTSHILGDDLEDMKINLRDRQNFGEIEDFVVNSQTGQIDSLVVSSGGLFDTALGDRRYHIPWNRIASVDRNANTIQVDAALNELSTQPNAEAAVGQNSGR